MVESLCLLWVFFWFLFWGNYYYTIFLSRFLTIQTIALWECNLFCDLHYFDSFPFACCIFPQNWGKHSTLLWSCAGVWTGTLHCISLDSRNSSSVFPGSYFMKQLFFYLNNIYMRDDLLLKKFPLKRAVMLEICSCRSQTRRQEAERVRETVTHLPALLCQCKDGRGCCRVQVAQLQPSTCFWTSTLKPPVTYSCCLKVPRSRSWAITAQTINQLVLTPVSL